MKKNFKYKIIGLALLVVSIVSCETADQDVSPIVEPDDSYPVVTYTLENTGTITEGDTIVYTITLSTAIDRSLTFNAQVDEDLSTAEEHVDFDIETGTMAPYETEAQVFIITYKNIDTEDKVDEIIAFEFGISSLAEKYLVHPSTVHAKPSISLKNYESDDLVLEFSWNVDIDLGDIGVYPASANVDFDIFMSDADSYDSSDPWASVNWAAYAATGAHPEVITLSGMPDGEYVFWFDLWANAFWGYGNTTDIPVTTWAYKAGTTLNYKIDQDPASVINADTPGVDDDGTESNGTLVKVTVAGTTYTVTDYSDVVVGTGKSVSDRTPRPASLIKK